MPDRVHLLSAQCSSCIFGPASAVGPDRVREVIRANLATGSLLMCHSTLYGQTEREAICRGFWDTHGHRVNTTRVMDRVAALTGTPWYVEVPPPSKEDTP